MSKVKLKDIPVGTVFRLGSKLFQKVPHPYDSPAYVYAINLMNQHHCSLLANLDGMPLGPEYPLPQSSKREEIKPLAVNRVLGEDTRLQEFLAGGKVYSLHRTDREVIVTATDDYSKVYQITSAGFFDSLEKEDD